MISKNSSIADLLPGNMSVDDFYTLLAAIAAFFIIFAVGKSLSSYDPFAKRVKELNHRRTELREEALAAYDRKRLPLETGTAAIRSLVKRFNLIDGTNADKTRRLLYEAGFRSKDAIIIYSFLRTALPLVFGGIAFTLMDLEWKHIQDDVAMLFAPVLAAYAGMALPAFYVKRKCAKRRLMIQRGLPDALDMMMVCAEAGLTLSSSLSRVSRELKIAHQDLAEELSMTSIEMGFLAEARLALDNFANRVNIEEIRSLTNVLIQTEKYGTPVAQALRVLSAEFRNQRMLRAEDKAARLPALMTVPLIVFILPTLFIIIMTPAILQLMSDLG